CHLHSRSRRGSSLRPCVIVRAPQVTPRSLVGRSTTATSFTRSG
ncbi:MAG: hypothetical protein AVDCRST_MAG07-1763, partial [uncultured Frankineae bacterium]